MQAILKFLAVLSVPINFYFHLGWIIIFNHYNSHAERVAAFRHYLLGLSPKTAMIMALLLTIVSLVVLFTFFKRPKVLRYTLMVIQVLCFCIYMLGIL